MSNMDDWFRDPSPRSSGSAYPGGGPAGHLPHGAPSQSAWPSQPPPHTASPGRRAQPYQGGGRAYRGGGGGRRWLRPRRILGILALVLVLILVFTGVMYFYLNSKLTRINALADYNGRPVAGAGQNWLITGSDSRQGLTRKEERQLATGRGIGGHRSDTIMVLHIPGNGLPAVLVSIPRDSYVDIPGFGMNKVNAAYDFGGPKLLAKTLQNATGRGIGGHRSDTIMVLHIPGNGLPAVLVSIPRDSYVDIPGFGMNKINAAYDFGGPKLLAKTVQNATGLYISHFMSIGFGGLVNVVNAVGGVRMCIPSNLNDPASGLHLKKGCQNLDGAQALGFVRTRHLFATQDLQREQDQRVFIKALLTKMTSPGTLANPFHSFPAAFGAAGALTVDKGTQLYQLVQVAFALRHPETTTVPIGGTPLLAVGDVVIWDHAKSTRLFDAMRNDTPVPKGLLSGSKLAAGA